MSEDTERVKESEFIFSICLEKKSGSHEISPLQRLLKHTVPTAKLRPPSFCVYSYGATCLTATRKTF